MSTTAPAPLIWRRRPTFEVKVGDLGVGAQNPLRVQSMTTTDTRDVKATAAQIEQLAAAGCEIVRVTAPSIRDAEALAEIRAALGRRGVHTPLVADIHFTPNAALEAALHVEKVRINPGNYADRKKFQVREYSDAEYRAELERVAERFRPLPRRCRELGRALRIGVNHGSLSDRIMNRFGDTPLGMVESALEFLDVCEDEGFRAVIFSMKSSNPQVAIHAYRLLAARLSERAAGAPSYPLHLGVTEAGDGDEGRIKSAIGIGALLEDGLGDTLRVSLTEDPLRELPVARALAARYDSRARTAVAAPLSGAAYVEGRVAHTRRRTRACGFFGAGQPVRVEAQLGPVPLDTASALRDISRTLSSLDELACEGLQVEVQSAADVSRLAVLKARALVALPAPPPLVALTTFEHAAACAAHVSRVAFPITAAAVAALPLSLPVPVEWIMGADEAAFVRALGRSQPAAVSACGPLPTHAQRRLVAVLRECGCDDLPVVLRHRSDPLIAPDADAAMLHAAVDLGAALCDGIGDVVSLGGLGALSRDLQVAYRILQGARLRTTWTEFISCPSCGRTLFDLEETTARVKAATEHLVGLKIAVMGCIVNGPGEMADADFGYVGSGVRRVDLYAGQERVVRGVPASEAPERLVELIRAHGRWVEPGSEAAG